MTIFKSYYIGKLSTGGLLLLLLSGCYTEMKVRVDIMDQSAIKCSPAYRDKVLASFQETRYFAEIETLFKNASRKLWDETAKKAKVPDSPETTSLAITSATTNMMSELRTEFQKIKDSNSCNLDLNIKTFQATMPYKIIDRLRKEIDGEGVAISESAVKPAEEAEVVRAVQNVNAQTIYGGSITQDPIASMIVQAPESYWKKFEKDATLKDLTPEGTRAWPTRRAQINKTTVRTFMGNADIAVKMDGPAFFVVKGVRLDADQAFKMSAKVLNQGIKYLAYANGIPVGSPAGTTDAASKLVKIPEINDNDSLVLKMQQVEASNKLAAKIMLTILFAESDKLAIPRISTADVKSSVSTIKQAFGLYKAQVTPPQTPNQIP